MPNHVFHSTTYKSNNPAVLRSFVDLAEDDESIIASFVPLPPLATEPREYTDHNGVVQTTSVFTPGGAQTAIDLWGSKWADYDVELVDSDETTVSVRHKSAWAPCLEGLRKVSALTQTTIYTSWTEEFRHFVGAAAIVNGTIVGLHEYSGDLWDAKIRSGLKSKGLSETCPDDSDSEAWTLWHETILDIECDALDECEQQAFRCA